MLLSDTKRAGNVAEAILELMVVQAVSERKQSVKWP
jgi:hypothetical protein